MRRAQQKSWHFMTTPTTLGGLYAQIAERLMVFSAFPYDSSPTDFYILPRTARLTW